MSTWVKSARGAVRTAGQARGRPHHTHKGQRVALKELWAKVANEYLERTGNRGRAIREANAVGRAAGKAQQPSE
jgi:hypothetical protein